MTIPLSPAERSYIISGLTHPTSPTRLDGRRLLDSRPISISYGDAPQANGSARVVIQGGTEVVAGIRLEVTDVNPASSSKGKEGWRGTVTVDVTPQAYPQLRDMALTLLSNQFAQLLTDHFMPCIPPFPIAPPTKYFVPHLHLTLLSASSGSIPSVLVLAARAAFCDLLIPKTKTIGWETTVAIDADTEKDLSGIKAAVRAGKMGKGKGRAVVRGGDDWDLDREGGGVIRLGDRRELPVLVVLNLITGSEVVFLDASTQEETACPDRIQLFFTGKGRVCGIRSEGGAGLDAVRIRPLVQEGRRIAMELLKAVNAEIPS